LIGPRLEPQETAIQQIEKLGYSAGDVRHVVLTHLDLDHAGGLPDFPKAKVHVFEKEHRAAMSRPTFFETRRYRPAHWAHDPTWVLHRVSGERWFHFEAVHALGGKSSADVLLVPLVGHTRGHCGVALRTHEGWMLHCGDAYFFGGEMDPHAPRCTPGLSFFQRTIAVDDGERLRNQERLRALVRDHGSEVKVFCAHDPLELERMRQGKARAKAA
jgi:glyoxylase-like metal-dependent hydrolase (beta-lactamase superfamily II)